MRKRVPKPLHARFRRALHRAQRWHLLEAIFRRHQFLIAYNFPLELKIAPNKPGLHPILLTFLTFQKPFPDRQLADFK
jgi:hypothetical protein